MVDAPVRENFRAARLAGSYSAEAERDAIGMSGQNQAKRVRLGCTDIFVIPKEEQPDFRDYVCPPRGNWAVW